MILLPQVIPIAARRSVRLVPVERKTTRPPAELTKTAAPAAPTGRLTGWGAAVRNATGPVRVCRGTAGSVLTIRPAMTEGR